MDIIGQNVEVVGYDIIGQDKKEEANVIGYGYIDEQSIDGFSNLNANNNTSTGLATVIPGVNGPRLIQSTSIYKNKSDDVATFSAKIKGTTSLNSSGIDQRWIYQFTISEEKGEQQFKQTDRGILIPVEGNYKLDITYQNSGSMFHGFFRTRTENGGLYTEIDEFTGDYSKYGTEDVTITKYVYFLEGDIIQSYIRLYTTYPDFSWNPSITYVITKI